MVLENADITNIAVDEEYRRQGIGDRLIELISLKAADKGAESLFLEVRESNEPAKVFMKKWICQSRYAKKFLQKT